MQKIEENTVRLSVRDLVEFVLRSGDIDNRRSGARVTDAMLVGASAHRRIQKKQGGEYTAEVPLKISVPLYDNRRAQETEEPFLSEPSAILEIEGRADGIIEKDSVTIDEIKGVYRDIQAMEEPERVHLAQAEVYAYIYALQQGLPKIRVQITYVQLEETDGKKAPKVTDELRYFTFDYSFDEIREVFFRYAEAYRKWALFVVHHREARVHSAQDFEFPYDYRPGQQKIVRQVFRTVRDKSRLFVQAPTGIGKTLAMLYPSVRAVGEGMGDKIFYLTAKTVTSGVAEEGMKLMTDRGLAFSYTKITAKEKLCPGGDCDCNPEVCTRAKGHFDRVNEAVYDLITHETAVSQAVIEAYAEKHSVCPYEMCLDVTYYTDVIICDYNYAFAPHVFLQRYFAAGAKQDYIFLIDEAHNLVDRARDMFSAALVKEDVLAAKKLFENQRTVLKWLEKVNKTMLSLKRECTGVTVYDADTFPTALLYELTNLYEAIERFLDRNPGAKDMDRILDFFFEVSDFLSTAEVLESGYVSYGAFTEEGHFYIKLFCIDPSGRLKERLDEIRSTVFFSATFLPVNYYKELLTGDTEEDAMYVDSPFDPANRVLLLAKDVSSKYTRRSDREYQKIASYIRTMVAAKKGNYLVFFPSHRFLTDVAAFLQPYAEADEPEADKPLADAPEKTQEDPAADAKEFKLITQKRVMREEDRQAFLSEFAKEREGSLLGLSVMGGVFSEGIDLREEQLIGVAVVGTGLPQVCTERELIKNYYAENLENGFDFAYRFPGFNKVMQAAGRLIRTVSDEGVILLLDERFLQSDTLRLFPKEWRDFRTVSLSDVSDELEIFWDGRK